MTTTQDSGNMKRTLVLVLCLAVSISILATPFLAERRTKSGLTRAAQIISSTVHLTRQKAIASETAYRIAYDYRDQFFRVYRQEAGHWVLDTAKDRFPLPQGVILSANSRPASGSIIIDKNGYVISGHEEVLLKLLDSNANRLAIRVSRSGQLQEFQSWQ
jgi:hypothetical protein